jgi:hypothetical protein
MPKTIVRDVFGELLETGKQTAKAGKKAAGDVAKQTAKTLAGHKSGGKLEKGASAQAGKPAAKQLTDEEIKEKQLKRLQEMDKKQSRQAYQQIQDQIRLIQKQKASQPRKYVTGKAEFDEEQVKAPETFWEKMKKKQKEAKKKILPWTSKKGMGTGEIRRGISG